MMTRVLTSRFGAFGVAIVLALVAAVLVLVYVQKHDSSVQNANGQVTVLVATRTISQFTPGNQVVDGRMFRETKVSRDSLADGAITNPDALKGLVARDNVYPGEQLTTNQFQRSQTTSVAVKLKPDQRAIALPVDPGSGLIGQVQSGDHVDVVGTFDVLPVGPNGLPIIGAQPIPLTRTIVSDALVLTAPVAVAAAGATASDSSHGPDITLAIGTADVDRLMFAQAKGQLWFVLRPPGSNVNVNPLSVVDVDAVLRGASSARPIVLRLTGANR
jgi:Flp pilus assembly protein CpaB